MKKIITFLTTIILFLCFTVTTLASIGIVGPDGDTIGYKPTDTALRLTIVSDDSSIINSGDVKYFMGHSFIEIDNITSVSYSIGPYKLSSYEKITIGLFGTVSGSIGAKHGDGIYINYEGNQAGNVTSNNSICLSTDVKFNQLHLFDNIIQNENYYDLFSHNCCHFALKVWNTFSNIKLTPNNNDSLITPLQVYNTIYKCAGKKVGYTFKYNYNYYKINTNNTISSFSE